MNGNVATQLEKLEQELKCVICLCVFDDPHSLPCNHQFCHECIEESFKNKSQCPLCKLPTFRRSINKNQNLCNIIAAYHNLKEALEKNPTHGVPKASPSPRKKRTQEPIDDSIAKRLRRDFEHDGVSPQRPRVPPGCMDFTADIENMRNDPNTRAPTREIATQTSAQFDPYMKKQDTDFVAPFSPRRSTTPTTPTTSTTPTAPTTPTTPTNSKKIDLKNITDWNSLKKPNTTSPSSTRHIPSPYPHSFFNRTTSPSPTRGVPTNSITNNLPKPLSNGYSVSTSTTQQTKPNLFAMPTSPTNHKPKPTPNGLPPNSLPPHSLVRTNDPHSITKANLPLTSAQNGFGKSTAEEQKELTKPKNAQNGSDKSTSGQQKEFPKSKCRSVVVLLTSLDTTAMANAKKIVKELGGSVITKYSSDVSHIVAGLTGGRSARRTLKYCMGVVEGKWIVAPDWLTQSSAASFWVAEQAFEVFGDTVTKGGAKTARESVEQKLPLLFTNCHVYLSGEFATSPTKAEIKKLIQLGDGQVSMKEPKEPNEKKKKRGQATPDSVIEVIVCHSTAFSSLPAAEAAKIKGLGRPVVDVRWVLDCVSFYKILPCLEYECVARSNDDES